MTALSCCGHAAIPRSLLPSLLRPPLLLLMLLTLTQIPLLLLPRLLIRWPLPLLLPRQQGCDSNGTAAAAAGVQLLLLLLGGIAVSAMAAATPVLLLLLPALATALIPRLFLLARPLLLLLKFCDLYGGCGAAVVVLMLLSWLHLLRLALPPCFC